MKKCIKLTVIIIIISLTGFSCSNIISNAIEKINSDVTSEDYLKKYAQFPKTKSFGIKWHKYPLNSAEILPVLPAGGSININDQSVLDPSVLKVGENDYRMWYTKITINNVNGIIQKVYSIGYAVSADGISWSEKTSPTNVPVADHQLTGVRVSCVIATDNPVHTYRMWYLGKQDINSDTGWQLYYAYTPSIDGGTVEWKTERFFSLYKSIELSPDRFDSRSISRAYVMKGEGQTDYKMWYGGYSSLHRKIGYAASLNGKNKWTKHFEIMSPGFAQKHMFDDTEVEYPCVIEDEGVYKMWYSGYNTPWRIGLAYSLDGKKFDYYDNQFGDGTNEAVLKPEAFWEGRGIMNCSVIKDTVDKKKVYKMWYTAEGNDGKFRIGYAESYE